MPSLPQQHAMPSPPRHHAVPSLPRHHAVNQLLERRQLPLVYEVELLRRCTAVPERRSGTEQTHRRAGSATCTEPTATNRGTNPSTSPTPPKQAAAADGIAPCAASEHGTSQSSWGMTEARKRERPTTRTRHGQPGAAISCKAVLMGGRRSGSAGQRLPREIW